MTKLALHIAAWLGSALVAYVAAGFIAWDWNPESWTALGRMAWTGFVAVIAATFSIIIGEAQP